MKRLWLVCLVLLSGCGTFEVYGKGGVAYQIDDQTDYYLQTDRDWNCDNPAAIVAVGMRNDKGTYCELMHRSWWRCGTGDNSDPETYYNEFGCGVETDFKWMKKLWRARSDFQ
ncbi:MAG: hypothetical protein V3U60_11200 [Gammaproteobacteria bacterium]